MPTDGMRPPFVAFGDVLVQALKRAYVEAVRHRAAAVGTLDLLVHVVMFERRTPPWLLAGARPRLIPLAAHLDRISALQTEGDAAPLSEFDPELRAVLREVEWRVRRSAGHFWSVKESAVDSWDTWPRWTGPARAVLAGTLVAARDSGMPFAGPVHFGYAMLSEPDCDGTRFVCPDEPARVAAVQQLSGEPARRRPDPPYPEFDEARVAMWPRSGRLLDRLAGRFFARVARLARTGPLLAAVGPEARRQAVRAGHGVVGPAHTLLAILVLDATLTAARIPVPAHHSSRNRAASVLRAHGVDAGRLGEAVALRAAPADPPAELLTEQLEALRPGDPFDSAETIAAHARARELSLAHRHPDTGTGHLLLALLENGTGEAAAVLRELGADPAAIRDQVENDLRAAPPAWPAP
ncbi:Clp protease N-terminal domain-containing protein [Paractinoplanes toevensis]|uniref:Clp R domain-containing protein n=1 Tax=Paractinoplanes toevensis TaxID=571911 RepID=A0A919WAI2_9ACTN|nr:Clp protease N-terminal domain-containing protein [Actinoplanes toevensis]GIM96603.1 hypothetical protein Ato02nite_083960 [Actinoplanes toevensis]